MKFLFKVLLFCLLSSSTAFAQFSGTSENQPEMFYPVSPVRPSWYYEEANLNLSVRLLQDTFLTRKNDFVISPFSIYSAFALLANGANEKGEKILAEILGEYFTLPTLNNYLKEFMKQKTENVELANSVWGKDFSKEYIKTVTSVLSAEAKDLPGTTADINNWINEKTHGRITDLLPLTSTTPDTLYLINTVYFKDKWKKVFNPSKTIKTKFNSLDGEKDDTFFIRDFRKMDYYEDEEIQAVRIPYEHGDYITFFLPKETKDFSRFIENLDAYKLNISFTTQDVDLSLPRFDIEYDVSLEKRLKQWGLAPIFDWNTMFPDLTFKQPVKVESIIHKANISLGENGTEAAAATAILVTDGSAFDPAIKRMTKRTPYFIFKANRPFIFMINNGLFMGIYAKGKLIEEISVKF